MSEKKKSPIGVLLGATCSGKTAFALSLAAWLAERGAILEIIGADARQIYRELSVGTAKPTAEERGATPHHMVDVAGPEETFDASRYAGEARRCADEIYGRGGFPLLVGGSGLYIRAMIEGLFEGPGADPGIRRSLEEQAESEGNEALHRRLAECDPATAGRVHPNDRRRVIRALEVFKSTGRPISEFRAEGEGGAGGEGWCRPFYMGISWPSALLDERIEVRARGMLAGGMGEEAARLADAGLTGARSFEGLGYEDALALHRGGIGLEECAGRIARLHRGYAKRQRTWFRKMEGVLWLHPAEEVWGALVERAGEALAAHFAPLSGETPGGTLIGREDACR
jgi:tRNA dimethylallyltransferase